MRFASNADAVRKRSAIATTTSRTEVGMGAGGACWAKRREIIETFRRAWPLRASLPPPRSPQQVDEPLDLLLAQTGHQRFHGLHRVQQLRAAGAWLPGRRGEVSLDALALGGLGLAAGLALGLLAALAALELALGRREVLRCDLDAELPADVGRPILGPLVAGGQGAADRFGLGD